MVIEPKLYIGFIVRGCLGHANYPFLAKTVYVISLFLSQNDIQIKHHSYSAVLPSLLSPLLHFLQ